MKYTILTNLRSVYVGAVRIDVGMILIDYDGGRTVFGAKRRELRGVATGGMPTFHVLLDPEAPIQIEPLEGGNFLLLSDSSDKPVPLDGGAKLKVTTHQGQELVLQLLAENYREPKIEVRDIEVESCPFGEDVDREILKHWLGSGYPQVEWVDALGYRARLEGEEARKTLKKAEDWIESSRAYRARLKGNNSEEKRS